MTYISKEEFNELADVRSLNCISIYIPTSPTGERDKDQIRLKNQLKEVNNHLSDLGLQKREIDLLLQPAQNLLNNTDFWNKLSNGLAVLIYEDEFKTLISDNSFKPMAYVNDHLHLLQLIKEVGNKDAFNLLILSGNTVKLYEGDNEKLNLMDTGADFPKSLKDAIGFDYEQKSLQFRSGLTESESGMYHGHGSGSDAERKRESEKFYQVLDNALNEYLSADGYKPLLVASDENTFYHFRNVSTYPNLFDKPLAGNHEETPESELLEKSHDLLKKNIDSGLEKAKADFHELVNKGKSSAEIDKVIGAAYHGQVSVLFVNMGAELYGYFEPETNELTVHSKPETSSVDLLNFAAVHVMKKDGRVYLLEAEELPVETAPVNANFRYEVVSL